MPGRAVCAQFDSVDLTAVRDAINDDLVKVAAVPRVPIVDPVNGQEGAVAAEIEDVGLTEGSLPRRPDAGTGDRLNGLLAQVIAYLDLRGVFQGLDSRPAPAGKSLGAAPADERFPEPIPGLVRAFLGRSWPGPGRRSAQRLPDAIARRCRTVRSGSTTRRPRSVR